MPEPHWIIWECDGGGLHLPDGRKVQVTFGDEVLLEYDKAKNVAYVHDYRPRVLH